MSEDVWIMVIGEAPTITESCGILQISADMAHSMMFISFPNNDAHRGMMHCVLPEKRYLMVQMDLNHEMVE